MESLSVLKPRPSGRPSTRVGVARMGGRRGGRRALRTRGEDPPTPTHLHQLPTPFDITSPPSLSRRKIRLLSIPTNNLEDLPLQKSPVPFCWLRLTNLYPPRLLSVSQLLPPTSLTLPPPRNSKALRPNPTLDLLASEPKPPNPPPLPSST